MTEEEENAMLQKGEQNGIKRLYIDQGGLALRWPEYKKIAEEQADGLPTAKELESAGVNFIMSFWDTVKIISDTLKFIKKDYILKSVHHMFLASQIPYCNQYRMEKHERLHER